MILCTTANCYSSHLRLDKYHSQSEQDPTDQHAHREENQQGFSKINNIINILNRYIFHIQQFSLRWRAVSACVLTFLEHRWLSLQQFSLKHCKINLGFTMVIKSTIFFSSLLICQFCPSLLNTPENAIGTNIFTKIVARILDKSIGFNLSTL